MSTAAPQLFTQNESTAAQRRMLFHLTNTADGTDATGKTLAGADVQISKNGAAFGNAAGAATEIANGWYLFEFAAADLDTLNALAAEINEAGCDPVRVVHQVTAFDHNGSLASLATSAQVAAITSGTRNVRKVFDALESDVARALSMDGAIDATVVLGGTFDGATVTIQTCEDPKAAVPEWTTVASGAKTSAATVVVAGPHAAVRAIMSAADVDSAVTVVMTLRYPGAA